MCHLEEAGTAKNSSVGIFVWAQERPYLHRSLALVPVIQTDDDGLVYNVGVYQQKDGREERVNKKRRKEKG